MEALEGVTDGHLLRPGSILRAGDLYLRLRRWRDAKHIFDEALAIDPDDARAQLLCLVAVRRRKFSVTALSDPDTRRVIYQSPPAHFLLDSR